MNKNKNKIKKITIIIKIPIKIYKILINFIKLFKNKYNWHLMIFLITNYLLNLLLT